MHPSCRVLIHTAQEEEIKGKRAEGRVQIRLCIPNHASQPFPRAVPVQKASKEERIFTFYRAVI